MQRQRAAPVLIWVAVLVLAVLAGMLLMIAAGVLPGREPTSAQSLPVSGSLMVGDERIGLEVARTPTERETGLMFRDALPPDRGMAFVIDPPREIALWTKNVRFPIDMVFVRDGVVVSVAANVPPCTGDPCPMHPSQGSVDVVVELGSGRAADLGLEPGARLVLELGTDGLGSMGLFGNGAWEG